MAPADGNVVFAGEDHAVSLVVNLSDGARIEGEADVRGCISVEMDAGKGRKLADGSFVAAGLREIEFDNFVAGDRAGVLDFGFDLDGFASLDVAAGPSAWL